MKTLPDYIRPGLEILSIGLNPSRPSVRAGYYFANPRNRFWRALALSGLAGGPLEPGVEAVERLFERYGIGFTDVVKRPTSMGNELRARDFRRWVPVLEEHLETCAPRLAWFHGKVAFRQYLRYTIGDKGDVPWRRQVRMHGRTVFFVTPNPSPANARFSLDDITGHYRALAALHSRLQAGMR